MDAEALMGNREGEALRSGREKEPSGAEAVLAERPHLRPLPGTVASGGSSDVVPGARGWALPTQTAVLT